MGDDVSNLFFIYKFLKIKIPVMKKFIITLLITAQVVCSFAQKYASIDSVPGAPVFICTQNTALEVVKDKKFITANTKIFLDFLQKALDQNLLEDSAKTSYLLETIEQANIILGRYEAAEKSYFENLAKNKFRIMYFFPDKVFLDVKTGKEISYSAAISNELKNWNRRNLEAYGYFFGPGMLHNDPQLIIQTAFGFLSSDTTNFKKNLETWTYFPDTKDKRLSMTQFSDFLYVYAENLVADAVVNDFLKVTPFDYEKWNKVWESKLYHFTKEDSLHEVLACNYQVFDRNFFDPGILWNNPGEIPGNHIDDDSNGIVDDINGYEYNMNNQSIKEPVALSWKETDSIGAVKNSFRAPPQFRAAGVHEMALATLDHGSMAIELMLKGNPRVQFMALDCNQYNFPAWYPVLFTTDFAHNQQVVDSLITIFINSFREMAEYCNHYKVRVVEINSIGANEKDFYLKGCGKDSSETKEFAKKMFTKLKDGMTIAYLKAPNTLYVNGAGNDNINIDSIPDMLNFIRLPNIIIAGALYKDLQKASYSCYGKGVDVFAPAHFPLQLVKFKSKVFAWLHNESNGTSAAAPVVANLAIQILELNPNLTAAQVKQLIINGADKEPYEKGINIIDPKKTIALVKAE